MKKEFWYTLLFIVMYLAFCVIAILDQPFNGFLPFGAALLLGSVGRLLWRTGGFLPRYLKSVVPAVAVFVLLDWLLFSASPVLNWDLAAGVAWFLLMTHGLLHRVSKM